MALPAANPPPHPPCATAPRLGAAHGFFGRRGGVSAGVYESLNAGLLVGDAPAHVHENRARIAAALGLAPDMLFSLKQVHGERCVHVVGDPGAGCEGDAMVTDAPGIGLGILTADCAPVLFAADSVVGAAHAGWGGALKGILESTLDAMKQRGARDIRAAIGPCIGPDSYEVSAGFEAPFIAEDPASRRFFKPGRAPDKWMFDLPGYCAFRLERAGVAVVDTIGHDTLAMEDAYFSHRRATLRGDAARGLQLSVISLKQA